MPQIHFRRGERPLHQQLTRLADEYFAQRRQARTGTAALYTKALIILSLYGLTYGAIFLLPQTLNLIAWLAHGIATALLGFNVMHDGAHQSFSQSRFLNRLAALSFNLIGSNRFYWAQKHNRNHHSFTNVDEVDEDIDAMGLLRMSPHQRRYWFHRGQHIYAWLLYPLTSLFWFFVLDYRAWWRQKIGQRDFARKPSGRDQFEFWLSKCLYLVIYLLIPLQFFSPAHVLSGFLLMHAALGFLFAVVFQLAHVVDKAEFLSPDEQGALADEWAAHQLRTTVDFAPDNRLLSWLLGGLNFQVEHHLFPRISHVHYPALHRLLSNAGMVPAVRCYPGLWQALKGHYHHLRQLGQANRRQPYSGGTPAHDALPKC